MNLPIKFGTNPITIFLVIVVTDRNKDTQTNAGKNILPRFRGDNKHFSRHCQAIISKAVDEQVMSLLSDTAGSIKQLLCCEFQFNFS